MPERLAFEGWVRVNARKAGLGWPVSWDVVFFFAFAVVETDAALLKQSNFIRREDSRWDIVLPQEALVIVTHFQIIF